MSNAVFESPAESVRFVSTCDSLTRFIFLNGFLRENKLLPRLVGGDSFELISGELDM